LECGRGTAGSDDAASQSQIVAEELGGRLKRVDTGYIRVGPGSYGRVTLLAREASRRAAADAKRQLLEFALRYWQVLLEGVEMQSNPGAGPGSRHL